MSSSKTSKRSDLAKSLGPGILFAGAAIGASHLVQSTKAGAVYGFALIPLVILANLFKYPFFEFCRRYTAATDESMLEGYRRLGRGSHYTFFAICILSAFLNLAAVTAVTAALAGQLFGINISLFWWSAVICAICLVVLAVGKYPALDSTMKAIILVLAVSTIVAFSAAMVHGGNAAPGFTPPTVWNAAGIAFLLALMGWMPAPIDVAVWPSLWALQRRKQTGHRPTKREALFDFNIGYIGSAALALFFLGLGALVMFGTGEKPAQAGVVFAGQLIGLYTFSLGGWSFYFIAAAAFTCMFSTTITCFDAYTRAISAATAISLGREEIHSEGVRHWSLMAVFMVSTLAVIGLLMKTMGHLVDLATIIAFLTAPILAVLNLRVITADNVAGNFQPPVWLRRLAYCGIVFLIGFAVLYLLTLFGA
jgi:Mn2+/Fe2+ NRAMP family transporter